jgi:hypothetical protein
MLYSMMRGMLCYMCGVRDEEYVVLYDEGHVVLYVRCER